MSTRAVVALGCAVAFAVTVGIVAGGVLLMGLWSVTTAAAIRAAPQPTPVPKYVELMKPVQGYIRVLNDFGAYGAVDEALAIELSRLHQANDAAAIESVINAGRAWRLSNGTIVLALEYSGPVTRVQLLNGMQTNRVVWVPTNAINQ